MDFLCNGWSALTYFYEFRKAHKMNTSSVLYKYFRVTTFNFSKLKVKNRKHEIGSKTLFIRILKNVRLLLLLLRKGT